MDVLGPSPVSTAGNKYLLVIVDCFTKWVEAFPLRNVKATTVAEIFVNQVISRSWCTVRITHRPGKKFRITIISGIVTITRNKEN